ncbi:hypothetical protein SAMN05216388_1017127 [Halorientalis persicus]|uniref:Double zinc ribbon n=1 Tax=Halorientalis persicus TaxID=1367881 RepID=A0A1H8S452_9EURY|nr:hypothetical protein [Halorientalis persicus]SEO72943.1 hypothetical protein SAMN05216388_1017127 [Halorientalis persicus]
MTAACPDCDRPLAEVEPGVGACHNCNEKYQLSQCEYCGDRVTEAEARAENAPGATLWFCRDCATTRRRTA